MVWLNHLGNAPTQSILQKLGDIWVFSFVCSFSPFSALFFPGGEGRASGIQGNLCENTNWTQDKETDFRGHSWLKIQTLQNNLGKLPNGYKK